MRYSLALTALLASAQAIAIPQANATKAGENMATLMLSPTDVRNVTQDEKIALKKSGKNFFDITYSGEPADLAPAVSHRSILRYPDSMQYAPAVRALIPKLSINRLNSTMASMTSFPDRFFNGANGVKAAAWLKKTIDDIIHTAGASANVTCQYMDHSWDQPSIIVRIAGRTDKRVILGASIDTDARDGYGGASYYPGADQNASGSMSLLEALRVLLTDKTMATGAIANTLEFHWYAGGSSGLLGSQAVFKDYARHDVDVVAMLNQDMVGYVRPTTEPVVGVVLDYINWNLSAFVVKIINNYLSISWEKTECGYACSDHASANAVGYPASMTMESINENANPNTLTEYDTLDILDLPHILEFSKMAVGYAYELAMHTF